MMKQQYLLLRKENDFLKCLIGKSLNQKLKFEAGRILDEIHSKAGSRTFGKKALCYVTDKDEILGVGGSTMMKNKKTGEIVSNLILNNFGLMMAAMFSGNPAVTRNATLTDVGGSPGVIGQYQPTWFLDTASVFGMLHKVGSGTTPPVRADIDIETAFGSAPESGDSNPGNPVYNSGLGNFVSTSAIVAGGAGTVNEAVLKGKWKVVATPTDFTLFRDIISPGQAFIATQTITLDYTIQL